METRVEAPGEKALVPHTEMSGGSHAGSGKNAAGNVNGRSVSVRSGMKIVQKGLSALSGYLMLTRGFSAVCAGSTFSVAALGAVYITTYCISKAQGKSVQDKANNAQAKFADDTRDKSGRDASIARGVKMVYPAVLGVGSSLTLAAGVGAVLAGSSVAVTAVLGTLYLANYCIFNGTGTPEQIANGIIYSENEGNKASEEKTERENRNQLIKNPSMEQKALPEWKNDYLPFLEKSYRDFLVTSAVNALQPTVLGMAYGLMLATGAGAVITGSTATVTAVGALYLATYCMSNAIGTPEQLAKFFVDKMDECETTLRSEMSAKDKDDEAAYAKAYLRKESEVKRNAQVEKTN